MNHARIPVINEFFKVLSDTPFHLRGSKTGSHEYCLLHAKPNISPGWPHEKYAQFCKLLPTVTGGMR